MGLDYEDVVGSGSTRNTLETGFYYSFRVYYNYFRGLFYKMVALLKASGFALQK